MTTMAATRTYAPRGACREVFERRDPEVLIAGAAGTGKSRACLEKVHMMCLINPGLRVLMVRKTAASLASTALITYREHVAVEAIGDGTVRHFGLTSAQPAQFRYSNGATLNYGGMDRPSKIMSSEYDIIYVQEATELTENDWEALTTRLRNNRISFQQIIADCNPDRPTHWLKQRCDKGKTVMLYGRHTDNPVLYNDDGTITATGEQYVEKTLAGLTGVRRARFYEGKWVAAEGAVYSEWDESVHLTNRPYEPPAEWPRYWTIDFGYTNPFVCQFWAVDPDGRAYRYREIYQTQTLVEDHAKTILAVYNKLNARERHHEPKPRAIICDHDAEDRATLEKHLGMRTVAAKKSVSDGLQAVSSRLKVAGDGRPRLFLVRNALVHRDELLVRDKLPTCTEEEIGGYVWNVDKDAPVKKDDHGMDCMRYLVAHLDLRPHGNPMRGWM